MRVPGPCLYFPLILLVSVRALYYFAGPRVSLLRPGRAEAQALKNNFWAFLCFFVVGVNSLFIFGYH